MALQARKMTKADGLAFKERWRLANEFIDEEIRNTSPATKLQQLANLYEAAIYFGWFEKLRQDEELVWERWQQLRAKYA
jgi:hypothetical protein